MKKLKLGICITSLFLVPRLASANDYKYNLLNCTDCFGFIAPIIAGAETLASPEIGMIVYDTAGNSFRGYNQFGSWTNFSVSDPVVRTVTSTDNILVTDDTVAVYASSGAFTVTLPQASLRPGKVITIYKSDNNYLNQITVDGYSTETIGGFLNRKLSTPGESIEIQSDGTNWMLLRRHIPSFRSSYTPTGSWTSGVTTGSYTATMRRDGEYADIQFKVSTTGGVTAAVLGFDLPSGMTMDSSKLFVAGAAKILGWGLVFDTSASKYYTAYSYINTSSTTRIYAGLGMYTGVAYLGGTDVTNIVPMTFASGDSVQIDARVPITGWEN